MSTTEVVIEQVLVGFLVLAILALPFPPEHPLNFLAKLPGSVSFGVVIAGVAYMLGVPFDRLADSIMAGLERRARLRFAWESCCRPLSAADPFPEAALRFDVLHQGHASALAYMDYLRSRMRITRAIAVYAPALAASVMLDFTGFRTIVRAWILIAISAAYGATAAVVEGHKPPLATTSELLPLYRDAEERRGCAEPAPALVMPDDVQSSISPERDPLLPCTAVFALGLALLAAAGGASAELFAVLLGGVLLSAVSGWAWWRITKTQNRFLCLFARRQWSERPSGGPARTP